MEQLRKKLVGKWKHSDTGDLEPFLTGISATGRLKRQMETMTPTILIEDLPSGLKFQHIMNPDKPQNDLVYTIATPPHQLEVCLDGLKNTLDFEWQGEKLVVSVHNTQGVFGDHTIEYTVDEDDDLLQTWKVNNGDVTKAEVTFTYQRADS